jgi:hypothetical protein
MSKNKADLIMCGPALTAHGSLDLKQEIQIQTGLCLRRSLIKLRPLAIILMKTTTMKTVLTSIFNFSTSFNNHLILLNDDTIITLTLQESSVITISLIYTMRNSFKFENASKDSNAYQHQLSSTASHKLGIHKSSS